MQGFCTVDEPCTREDPCEMCAWEFDHAPQGWEITTSPNNKEAQ